MIFLVDFFRAFGALWVLLGRLLGFLRVSWEVSGPKNIKNHSVFSGFLKAGVWLFKAHDGPLGLILVSLVNLFWILCKSAGPIWVPKLHFYPSYFFNFVFAKKNKEKNGQALVPFLSSFGNHFGAHFGTRSAKEGAR